MHDVIIIGGGFAGLSAAALLSKQGRRVLLLEKASVLGGRAACFEQDGFVWQYGQHSHRLEKRGIAAQVFDRLDEPLEFIDTRGNDAYLYLDGRLYPRPDGLPAFLRTKLMPVGSRLNFLRFFAKLARQKPEDWYDTTLLEFYRTSFGDPAVERFLSFLGFTVMVPDPALVSAGEVIQFVRRAARARVKQGEPAGGAKQVIDKLARITQGHGGEIHGSELVESICVECGKAVGVRTQRGTYEADKVVFAAPLFDLFEVVDAGLFDRQFVHYVKNIESSRGLSIDFVFDGPVTDIKGGILGVDLPLWVKFQTNIDTTVAPPGKHVHTWAMLFERGAPITPELVQETEARIKGIMEDVLPGVLGKVVRERKLVIPVINGNVLKPEQSYPHRPGITCEDVKDLYFIGDTVRAPGCSGDISFASAMMLADMLA